MSRLRGISSLVAVLLTLAAAVPARAEAPMPSATPTVSGSSEIFATFASAAGEAGIREVRLLVDGVDVTSRATVSALRVSYTPSGKLAAGTHEAVAVVTDSLGRKVQKAWTFEVAGPESVPPELVVFTSHELVVELDPLPRSTDRAEVEVRGTSQPGVEVELRVEGRTQERVMTTASGRFEVTLTLESGLNDIVASATRMETLESGPEAHARVELLSLDDGNDAPPVDVKPPVSVEPRDLTLPRDPAAVDIPRGEVERPSVPAPGVPQLPRDEPAERLPRLEPPPASDDPGGDVGGPGRRGTVSLPRDRTVAMPGDVEPMPPAPLADVVITKPQDGESIQSNRVTVLGRAPAGWQVTILVSGVARGSDVANPAGHFTVPRVPLPSGESELVAEAVSPDGAQTLRSVAVRVTQQDASPYAPADDVVVAPTEWRRIEMTSPDRRASVARAATLRVEGMAWNGATIEVEVNGRLAATDFALASGRFALDVPLEAGSNSVAVDAIDLRTGETQRSDMFHVTRVGRVVRTPAPGLAQPTLPSRLEPPGSALPRLPLR